MFLGRQTQLQKFRGSFEDFFRYYKFSTDSNTFKTITEEDIRSFMTIFRIQQIRTGLKKVFKDSYLTSSLCVVNVDNFYVLTPFYEPSGNLIKLIFIILCSHSQFCGT